VDQGGVDLAMLAGLVIERIRGIETHSDATFAVPAVAIAGSILEHAAAVRAALIRELRSRYPGIRALDTPADPPAGALWRARQGTHPSQPAG
jgi:glucosamine kinase